MRRFASEGELHLDIGQSGRSVDGITRVGMPVEHRVQAFENAFPHHVGFASPAFFRRATEEFHRSGSTRCFQPLGHGDGTRHGAGSQQVMAASMARRARNQDLRVRDRILRHPGDGIILGHHADDRRTAAVRGDECGRNPGHAPLYREALRLEEGDPQVRTVVFVVGDFRIVENPLLQGVVQMEMRVQIADSDGVGTPGSGRGERRDREKRGNGRPEYQSAFHVKGR